MNDSNEASPAIGAAQELVPPAPFLRPDANGGWDCEVRLAELPKPLDFAALYGREAPLHLEVGFGSGHFLAERSLATPEFNWFGIEHDGAQIHRTRDKIRRRGQTNVRILKCDALYFLEDYPAPASVDVYHIYYSDPWPKKRHHKRRLFQPRLLPILERTMKPGGTLFVKTDVTAYYEVIAELLKNAPFLAVEDERRLDLGPLEGDFQTNFQRKAVEKGHPLHYLRLRRR